MARRIDEAGIPSLAAQPIKAVLDVDPEKGRDLAERVDMQQV